MAVKGFEDTSTPLRSARNHMGARFALDDTGALDDFGPAAVKIGRRQAEGPLAALLLFVVNA